MRGPGVNEAERRGSEAARQRTARLISLTWYHDGVKIKTTVYPHIVTDSRIAGGAPIIKGTRIAVRAIAGYYQLGMSVDEILQSLPHLTQSQVHAALAFYFDHQREIDRDLKSNSDAGYWRKQVKRSPAVEAKAA